MGAQEVAEEGEEAIDVKEEVLEKASESATEPN